ncbi:PKD domain-containing protein, partial [Candidatus Woesearchaeota archaeon]|nr:PKD domain-containing protein [Candidatus Woesearchaeota archaeon]
NDVAFDGSNSMGRIISWHWEFGDIRDKEDEGEIVHFTYIQHGSKVATLTVTDVFDNTAIDTINVEVTPR